MRSHKRSFILRIVIFIWAGVYLTGCGIQAIPQGKNSVEAAVAEVTNQYKRRTDLIPNLVSAVKGYVKHEEQVLTQVTEARAKATSVQIDPTKLNAETLKKYQAAQGELSAALGRLLMVTENYPILKANQNFLDLQAQLEGTENRIAVARQRLIESIRSFNDLVTVPPTSWTNSLIYHHEKMPQWDVGEQERKTIEQAPRVEF